MSVVAAGHPAWLEQKLAAERLRLHSQLQLHINAMSRIHIVDTPMPGFRLEALLQKGFQTGSRQVPDGFHTYSRRILDGFQTDSRRMTDGVQTEYRLQADSRQITDGFQTDF